MTEIITPSEEAVALAAVLEVLSSPTRVQLLGELRTPKAISEIRIASAAEDEEAREWSISRQAVRKHLRRMEEAGLVSCRPGKRNGQPVEEFVVNQPRLFAIGETVRSLARMRPVVQPDADTLPGSGKRPHREEPGPCLVLVHGLDEGTVFPLATTRASSKTRWTLGRRRGAEIALEYDPWISQEHGIVERLGNEFQYLDLPTNENGSALNGARLAKGERAALRHGDVLSIGQSLLVFRNPA